LFLSTGETDIFVITLVPLPTAGGNVLKSMENFRYPGGGDFTGRVCCSALDGKFVKAFGYTDGQLNGTLLVMKRSELEKHAAEGWRYLYKNNNLSILAQVKNEQLISRLYEQMGLWRNARYTLQPLLWIQVGNGLIIRTACGQYGCGCHQHQGQDDDIFVHIRFVF